MRYSTSLGFWLLLLLLLLALGLWLRWRSGPPKQPAGDAPRGAIERHYHPERSDAL